MKILNQQSQFNNTKTQSKKKPNLKSQKGQGLIEYLILVALMSVAAIGIMRSLNQTVNSQFADVIYSLQGSRKKAKTETLNESAFKKRDFSDFVNGAASGK